MDEDLMIEIDRAADFAQLQLLQRQLAERGKHSIETSPPLAALRDKLDQALAELGEREK